jgi:AhpD family alkylhydroperoxidase
MEARLKYFEVAPEGIRTMLKLELYVNASGLEQSLLHLIRIRASQIYGCAFCIDMHTKDARAQGETEQRIYALDAWGETPFYTDRERAALAWTEAVTLIGGGHVPDELYKSVREQFSAKELVDLTLAVISVNGGIRLATSFRTVPGSYHPHKTEPIYGPA